MSIDPGAALVTLSGPTMGTRFSASIPTAQLRGVDRGQLTAALQAAVDLVDHQMSPWIAGSALNQLNSATVGQAVKVPAQMRAVLNAALVIGRESGGAFDAGVYAHVAHWGFGREQGAPLGHPAPGPVASAMGVLCISDVAGTVTKLGEVKVDLCAIAKGYGVDLMADVLNDAGIDSYMVSIDGELQVAGAGDGAKGWAIGLERPEPGVRQVECVLHCTDLALATSGGYRHFHENGQGHVTHTIDPRTGAPLSGVRASVTVAHESCTLADAWATALMVMGPARGIEMARDKGLHALFLDAPSAGKPGAFKRLGSGIMEPLCLRTAP